MLGIVNRAHSSRGRRAAGRAGAAGASPVPERPIPAFLIVGTSHSGTTLVQRLAAELRGVRVPAETHFFETFAHGLLRRRVFPLDERELGAELRIFASLPTSRGMELDIEAAVAALEGRCASPLELFAAIVRALAGEAQMYGEKTPLHLLWWQPLAAALPALKLVGVVRDPRAVVASHVRDPWGWVPHVLAAERWAADQRELARARRALRQDRLLVVRYEDVVADPDDARARLARFLGVDEAESPSAPEVPLFLPWERKKQRALGPVDAERVEAWPESLSPSEVDDVTAICRDGMREFGYAAAAPARSAALLRLASLSPAAQATRLRFRAARARERLAIRRARLTEVS